MEVDFVYAVERVIEFQVDAENLDGNDVIHRQPGGFDGLFDSIHHHSSLVLGALGRFASLWVEANVPCDIECVAHEDAVAERQRFHISGSRLYNELSGCPAWRQKKDEK